jgi:CcmD family protein
MKSYAFLFWGYNVIWVGIVAYLSFLLLRIRQVSRRIGRLEEALSARAAAADERAGRTEAP